MTPGLVSIGLPVYNGSAYLRQALGSLINQTYPHIEIILSDNASTDATPDICQEYCARDSRLRYVRLQSNVGAIANHNLVYGQATGEFFMWASSDDIWLPRYVEVCVATLRADPDVVVAYTGVRQIDDRGQLIRDLGPAVGLDDADAVKRFRHLTDIYVAMQSIYGVIRSESLARTRLMRQHPGADRILFAEVGLLGKLSQAPETLYLRRVHSMQSVGAYPKLSARYKWANARGRWLRFPHFEYLWGYFIGACRSAPGWAQRIGCYRWLVKWCYWHRRELFDDLLMRS